MAIPSGAARLRFIPGVKPTHETWSKRSERSLKLEMLSFDGPDLIVGRKDQKRITKSPFAEIQTWKNASRVKSLFSPQLTVPRNLPLAFR